jgi:RHH-type proline utilization regulon transcriptional repressor/proline dehydrogenase/delta 1-pyrroline-5-carboxylate dehydrogenase
VPSDALQLVPGRGETVGAALVADPRVECVMFSGSTDVARGIARTLAGRLGGTGEPVPLIAETGGQNAMIVDSSALPEQVVADVVASAFDSAGQRCSALRVLCLQEEIAPRVLAMLRGAMAELALGPPDELRVDVGPVIDDDAARALRAHVETMRARGRPVWQAHSGGRAAGDDARSSDGGTTVSGANLGNAATDSGVHPRYATRDSGENLGNATTDSGEGTGAALAVTTTGTQPASGHFVAPTLIEIERIGELAREVFGPVLHVLTWRSERLDALIDDVNATGYGLTLGIHSRIDETIARITARARVGNVYVNRNVIGAVVGVQPFGGEGLSGTGPKAGGPLLLHRLLRACPEHAVAGTLAAIDGEGVGAALAAQTGGDSPLAMLRDAFRQPAAEVSGLPEALLFERLMATIPIGAVLKLPGPTGERNSYALHGRARLLCLADSAADLLAQLAAVFAVRGRAFWPRSPLASTLRERLPRALRAHIVELADWRSGEAGVDAVLHCGDRASLCATLAWAAGRPGALVAVHHHAPGTFPIRPERLLLERVTSINTAAAGGNATLMTIG